MPRSTHVAIDVGGTFTGVAELTSSEGRLRFDKVPTTPTTPATGVLEAFGVTDARLDQVSVFTHGTTLGTSAR